jgi:cyclic pyranopterin phosphate synthase
MLGMMVDCFGRVVAGLRIALTPRCNLNCIYCHHEGEANPNGEISDEMVVSVARAAAELGARSLKFTGGEPLLRRDLAGLIAQMPQELLQEANARREPNFGKDRLQAGRSASVVPSNNLCSPRDQAVIY